MSARTSLDTYRKKASFDADRMKSLLYGEDVIQYKQSVWSTLIKDPLFSSSTAELSVDQKRELTFKRLKRLVEYDFLPDNELFEHPERAIALTGALVVFDPSLLVSHRLHYQVSLRPHVFMKYSVGPSTGRRCIYIYFCRTSKLHALALLCSYRAK